METKVAAPQAFGPMLKRFRLEAGMSQVELATAAGFSMMYISMLERGKRRPPAATVDLLAGALELPAAHHTRLLETVSPTWHAGVMSLPAPVTSFVGRDVEVTLVSEMFRDADTRLVTLLGPGGVGKTRLAIEVARRIQFDVSEGAVFVPLDLVAAADDVADMLVDALGLVRQPGLPSERLLLEAVQDRNVLLVLDNFEHVLPAAAIVGTVLAAGPGVRVLTTSRSPLDVYGERLFRVEPLTRPGSRVLTEPDEIDVLRATASSHAATLFVDRAVSADTTFRLTRESAAAVARICDTLDGLPLAIELAAARVRHYAVATVAEQLSHPLAGLTSKATIAGERHQSLNNVFAWSFQLLDPRSQAVFRRLSVFAGGFTLEAAEAVCRFDGDSEVEPIIAGLIDASLVQRVTASVRADRLTMLQTVLQFARECLIASVEVEEAHRRHFDFYLGLAQRTSPSLWSAGVVPWEMDDEAPNLFSALAWSCVNLPWGGLTLASPLADYAEVRGQPRSALDWLRKTLAATGPVSSRPRGMPLAEARLARAKGLVSAAGLSAVVGEFEASGLYAAEGLAMFEQMGDRRREAWALNVSSIPALADGNDQRACDLLRRSLAIYREISDEIGIMQISLNLGLASAGLGDYTAASELLEETIERSRRISNPIALGRAITHLGFVLVRLGDRARAGSLVMESLAIEDYINDRRGTIEALELRAVLAGEAGDHALAARLLGATGTLRVRHNDGLHITHARRLVEQTKSRALAVLGHKQFEACSCEGSILTRKQAMLLGQHSISKTPSGRESGVWLSESG